ncbi:hypothetical protein KA005_78605, partial [bacterium]|nr:hypothetical protein [bacterium]
GMTFTWFEHGIEKGCVRKEFFYIRKPRKDYRLEVKEEENAVKVIIPTISCLGSFIFTFFRSSFIWEHYQFVNGTPDLAF